MPKGEGYAFFDHRFSPGMSNHRLGRQFGEKAFAEGKVLEATILTCRHCKIPQIMNPLRVRERHTCPKCANRYICDLCYADTKRPDYVHVPWDQLVDKAKDAEAKGVVLGSPLKLLTP